MSITCSSANPILLKGLGCLLTNKIVFSVGGRKKMILLKGYPFPMLAAELFTFKEVLPMLYYVSANTALRC